MSDGLDAAPPTPRGRRVVTLDGPAGAGKSTVARLLAQKLGWRLLDTGAMYRAVTLAALRQGADLQSPPALATLACQVQVRLAPGRVFLDELDVTDLIRTREVTQATRFLADVPAVRGHLVLCQRAFAAEHDVVAEGRDQGTVVFPEALLKVFLTASIAERARRRHAELLARGERMTLDLVECDVADRDVRDEARAIAPLKPAEDALILDTTGLNLAEVVQRIAHALPRSQDDPA